MDKYKEKSKARVGFFHHDEQNVFFKTKTIVHK